MIIKKTRMAAGVLAVSLILAGSEMDVHAVSMNSILPAAGIGLSLEEGVSLKSVTEETSVTTTTEIVEPVVTEVSEEVQEEIAEEAEEDFSDLVIAQVNDYVNVRSMPSEEGEIVGKLYDKSVGTFLEEDNGWYKIQSGKCTGYVKAEYCVTGEEANELAREVGRRVATVTTETLYVRQEPTTESAILGMVPLEEVLTVTEELDGWVQVKIEEGEGYVSADYVTLSTEFVEAESKEEEEARLKKEEEERQQALEASRKAKAAKEAEEAAAAAAQAAASQETTSQETTTTTTTATVSADTSSLGQQVANYGLQFVGNPYVYGGTSLTNGADCSGFTLSVYANFGVSLPHSASAQRKKGYDVGGIANAIPGDLVFYSGHVGIYIGNGQIVHASNSRTGIIVSSAYYDTIIDVRRIF